VLLTITKFIGFSFLAALLIAIIYLLIVFTKRDIALLFERNKSIQVGNTARNYRVFDPAAEVDNKPVVFFFHGLRDMPKWAELYTGLSNLAKEEQFIAVYPQGLHDSWNGGFCCDKAFEQNIDDIEFVRQLVETIKTDYSVDEARIYTAGFSNGGVLSQRLLAELPETFAAGASAMAGVGNAKGNVLNISQAKAPIMLMHATNDQYSAVDETRQVNRFQFLSAKATWQAWADQYGLGEVTIKDTEADPDVWTYGDNQLITKLYETSHRWPQWRIFSFKNEVPDSTREMWEFLSSNSRKELE